MIRRQPLILIVHTDMWVRAALSNMLTSEGWATRQVSNGWTGLQTAVKLQPELVLVGPKLSEIPSRDLIDQLRIHVRTKRIPVIEVPSGLERREPADADWNRLLNDARARQRQATVLIGLPLRTGRVQESNLQRQV
jgi:PleD family two-component response regulator